MTKKKWITIGVIALVAIVLYQVFAGSYNKMVKGDQNVKEQWANVETAYQRRADLIPNLVNTVKGYAEHEKETLREVMEARSKATSVNIDAKDLNANSFAQFQEAQSGLTSALSKLMVVMERYPDLKANQNFMELQAQLEGTENRIAVERRKFNETVKAFNQTVLGFPNNMLANMYGFEEKEFFKSEEGAQTAPKVEF
ncbi:MAG: LemA family protein [Bacteroidales bacterium]|nr:LemA family protein [Bacteroidales bacterium]